MKFAAILFILLVSTTFAQTESFYLPIGVGPGDPTQPETIYINGFGLLSGPSSEPTTCTTPTFEALEAASRGKCPICRRCGLRSTVTLGMCTSTALYCGSGYYTEDGVYVSPQECNTTTCSGSCSRGHRIAIDLKEFSQPENLYFQYNNGGGQ